MSSWTATEFVSALGLKVRRKELDQRSAFNALGTFRQVGEDHFTWLSVSPGDIKLAAEFLQQWDLGLRAADALHLAVAKSSGAKQLLTLDDRMLGAAKALRIPASTGIRTR